MTAHATSPTIDGCETMYEGVLYEYAEIPNFVALGTIDDAHVDQMIAHEDWQPIDFFYSISFVAVSARDLGIIHIWQNACHFRMGR